MGPWGKDATIATWYEQGLPQRRVMILAEATGVRGHRVPVPESSLLCHDPWARGLEWRLRARQWEIETMRDDHVATPCIEYYPQVVRCDFGVPSSVQREQAADRLAFHYEPSLTTLDNADFARLHHRSFSWNRAAEEQECDRLAQAFGDLLTPIRVDAPWQLGLPVTSTVLDLVGLEGFMTLMFDNPAGLHRLMAFVRDDNLAFIDFAEAQGFYPLNNAADYIGAGSMGYTRDLPQPGFTGIVHARDRWFGSESQESVGLGPDQYGEFVWPYLKAIAERFGKVYYGCCEPADPILAHLDTLPNLARVSVSPWADQDKMAAFCRPRGIVFSRKPSPNYFSEDTFNEAAVQDHLAQTVAAAQGCRLEIIQRDVYVTHDQPERFPRWVQLAREAAQAFRP